jgi:DNA replication protein DnaC
MELGGPLGVGKTFAAIHIGKEMIKRNQSVYFIGFLDLVSAFNSDDDELEEKLRDSTFLIIDELIVGFTDRQSSLFANRFEALIRHRSNYDLPTIITTNLSEEELTESYPRVYSLLSAKQVRIEFDGKDARPKKGSESGGMVIRGQKHPIT